MKKYNRPLILLFILSYTLLQGAQLDNVYMSEASCWANRVSALHLSVEEEILVANLLYFSAERSRVLIKMQDATAHYVYILSSVINDAMLARLNPAYLSSILNYSTAHWHDKKSVLEQAQLSFFTTMYYYRFVCATYAQCIEYILKTDIFRYDIDQEIRVLRNNSRIVRIAKFKEAMLSIQMWMDNLKQLMATFNGCSTSRGLSDFIIDFTQPALLTSFVKFDKRYNAFNAQAWKTLLSSYRIGNLIWKTLEEVRCEFYDLYYAAFKKEMGFKSFPIAFNEEGFIAPDERHDYFS